MKPTTDALNKWLQTMIIHPLFNQARFYRNNNSDATIEWEFVPRSVNKHTSIVPALSINIFNLKKNRNDEKFVHKMSLSIKTPDLFIANTDIHDKEDEYNSYFNIHLKDIIIFKKLCVEQFDKIRHLYFKNVPYEPAKSKEVYCKEYRNFLMFKESMFGYFYNCEKINAKLKDLKKDFVKGE